MNNLIFEKISWDLFEKDCIELSKKLQGLPINTIVGISRGGLIAARILSDLLALPISQITIFSYKNMEQKKEIKITETPSRSFNQETILIVDDVADTGKTFQLAHDYFKKQGVNKIYTLALYYKSKTKFIPNFTGRKIDAWIVYPYEVKETYDSFVQMFGTKEKAKNKMLEIGFKNWEIHTLK